MSDIADGTIPDSIPHEVGMAAEVSAVEISIGRVLDEATAITITNDEDYEAAGLFLVERIKAVRAEIEDTFGPMALAAHKAHREILAQRKRHEEPLIEAEALLKATMVSYYRQQEIARQRVAQEQLEAAKREAEDLALEEAARLERDGRQEAADDRLRQPIAPVVTAPAAATPEAAGVSMRKVWKFHVLNDGVGIDHKYMKVDTAKIGKVVRAMGKDAEELVGGIEVYEEISAAARANR